MIVYFFIILSSQFDCRTSNICILLVAVLFLQKTLNRAFLRIRKQRFVNALSIIGHLNINSMRNKFVLVENIIKAFDIFLISQSKLDCTFLLNQFYIARFKQFREDRNRFGGGFMLYINENIPCRPLNEDVKFPDLELIVLELH